MSSNGHRAIAGSNSSNAKLNLSGVLEDPAHNAKFIIIQQQNARAAVAGATVDVANPANALPFHAFCDQLEKAAAASKVEKKLSYLFPTNLITMLKKRNP
jgi:hypothetical protein